MYRLKSKNSLVYLVHMKLLPNGGWKVNEHNNLCEKNKDTSKIKVKTKQRKVNDL
jgi:hypothetical protein